MVSTNSLQAHYDVERDFRDLMVTRLADRDYTRRVLPNQFCSEGNHQPVPPIEDVYSNLEYVLPVEVQAGNRGIDVVKNLVEVMPIEALEHKNVYGQTVLSFAAIVGNTRAATILVRRHPRLLYTPDKFNYLPVHLAAKWDRKDTFQYLLSRTQDKHGDVKPFAGESGVRLVRLVIFSGYYDEALKLIDRYPELAKVKLPNGDGVLSAIASNVSAFPSGSHLSFWENAIYSCVPVKLDKYAEERSRTDIENPVPKYNLAQTFVRSFCIPVSQRLQAVLYKVSAFLVPHHIKHIGEKKQVHYQAVRLVKLLCRQIKTLNDYRAYEPIVKGPLLSAAKLGVKEVVEEILNKFQEAVWFSDDESHSVFELAILHRQEKVFSIIYQMDLYRDLLSHRLDKEENNMLHLVARLPPQNKQNYIPSALQMQRELQWFKEVENLVPPKNRLKRNNHGEIPAVLFTKEHEGLVREGEKWMKDTANSSAIVASLIATIAFAAAITGPGGNDNNGLPIFSKESAFIIFAISNALSLFTSAASLLMFLTILTSQYEENDFLYVLPRRLIIYLYTLFFSITTMLVSFTATLYLVAGKYKARILIPTAVVASVPIYILTSWQFPHLLNLIYSTYGTIFYKKNDRRIRS